MINFRFHLVSLVAVFLALALGVVVGSTVIDKAIVDRLSSQIDSVRARADEQRAENRTLRDQVKGLETFIVQSQPQVVGRRLNQVPVTVVAVRGVPAEDVRGAVDILRQAGALVSGVLWIEDAFSAPEPAARTKLVEAMGDSGLATDDLRLVALEALGKRLVAGPGPAAATPLPTSSTAPSSSSLSSASSADPLVALNEAGLVSFDRLGGGTVNLESWPAAGTRILLVDGSQARPLPGTVSLPMLRAAAAAGGRLALAEVFRPTATVKDRGAIVRGVRDDPTLSRVVSTVDDLDNTRGQVALTLAVQELGTGRAGHYGEGPGATSHLPTPEAAPPEGVPAATAR
ncbi:MAG TPA: copper transporter [Acidimicrobiia bacterium]|nr:copper transporter [Acidimicrobiia bacterium]